MRNRVVPATLAITATGGLLIGTAPTANAVEDNEDHDRATEIRIENATRCTFTLKRDGDVQDGAEVHGKWVASPPQRIPAGGPERPGKAEWKSADVGLMHGTSGTVLYEAKGCRNEGKVFKLYWTNPYVGSNKYKFDGTDPLFQTDTFAGKGNDAGVVVTINDRTARPTKGTTTTATKVHINAWMTPWK
jgi:hypothetical protein